MSEESTNEEPEDGTVGQLKKEGWKPLFLEAFREEMSVWHACKVVGIGRSTAYRHRKEDAEFREAWGEVVGEQNDELEASALKRAMKGWEEPVFSQGMECGAVRKYSTTLTIFMLKTRVPERFGQDVKIVVDPQVIAESIRGAVAQMHDVGGLETEATESE